MPVTDITLGLQLRSPNKSVINVSESDPDLVRAARAAAKVAELRHSVDRLTDVSLSKYNKHHNVKIPQIEPRELESSAGLSITRINSPNGSSTGDVLHNKDMIFAPAQSAEKSKLPILVMDRKQKKESEPLPSKPFIPELMLNPFPDDPDLLGTITRKDEELLYDEEFATAIRNLTSNVSESFDEQVDNWDFSTEFPECNSKEISKSSGSAADCSKKPKP